MQHQSQDLAKGPKAGTPGYLVSHETISSETIERHIAEGKRLQAEAIAAFFRSCFRLAGGVFRRPPHQADDPASTGAVPHRA